MTEFDELFGEWAVNGITVEPFEGNTFDGSTWGPPSLPIDGCLVDYTHRLIRTSEGKEITSSATISAPEQVAGHFTPNSRVTLPGGRTAVVVQVSGPDPLFGHTTVVLA